MELLHDEVRNFVSHDPDLLPRSDAIVAVGCVNVNAIVL
jgi:hypothetical protein